MVDRDRSDELDSNAQGMNHVPAPSFLDPRRFLHRFHFGSRQQRSSARIFARSSITWGDLGLQSGRHIGRPRHPEAALKSASFTRLRLFDCPLTLPVPACWLCSRGSIPSLGSQNPACYWPEPVREQSITVLCVKAGSCQAIYATVPLRNTEVFPEESQHCCIEDNERRWR